MGDPLGRDVCSLFQSSRQEMVSGHSTPNTISVSTSVITKPHKHEVFYLSILDPEEHGAAKSRSSEKQTKKTGKEMKICDILNYIKCTLIGGDYIQDNTQPMAKTL